MIRKLALSTLTVAALCTAPVMAAEGGHIHDYAFSFEGPFGTYDRAQLQRGLQVYNEVCSACHGLELVTFRSLADTTGPAIDADTLIIPDALLRLVRPFLTDLEVVGVGGSLCLANGCRNTADCRPDAVEIARHIDHLNAHAEAPQQRHDLWCRVGGRQDDIGPERQHLFRASAQKLDAVDPV